MNQRSTALRLVVQTGHTHNVTALAFHPRERLLATGGADSTIRLWDLRTMRERMAWSAHANEMSVTDLAFIDEGRTLLSHGYTGPIRTWTLEGAPLNQFGGRSKGQTTLAYARNQQIIATLANRDGIRLWGIPSGSLIRTLSVEQQLIRAIAFSPDGWRLAVVAKDMWLFDVATGQVVLRLEAPPWRESGLVGGSVAFSTSGHRIAAAWLAERRMYLIDSSTLRRVGEINDVTAVRALADDQFATFSDDTLQIRASSGTIVRSVHPAFISTPANRTAYLSGTPSPDGSLMASVQRNTILLWETGTGHDVATLGWRREDSRGNLSDGPSLVSNPMYPMFAISDRNHVRLWKLQYDLAPRIIDESGGIAARIAFHPRGHLLAVARGGQVRIWDVSRDRWLRTITTETVNALAFRPLCATLMTGHEDGSLRVWDTATGKLNAHIEAQQPDSAFGIVDLSFSRDGQRLTTLTGRLPTWIGLRDGATGALIGDPKLSVYMASAVTYGPRETSAIARGGNLLKLTEGSGRDALDVIVLSPSDQRSFRLPHPGGAWSVAFDPFDPTLATGGDDGVVRLWDPPFTTPQTLPAPLTSWVTGVAFSSDGRLLAAVDDEGIVRLWSMETRRYFATLVCIGDDHVCVLDDNHYSASRGALDRVAFRAGDRIVPFEQFDLRLNRPDRVLERLDYVLPDSVRYWRNACERRLDRHGLSLDDLPSTGDLPQLDVTLAPDTMVTHDRAVTLRVTARNTPVPLLTLQIRINGVPLFGAKGFELTASKERQWDFPLRLSAGENHLEVSATDLRGAESIREIRRVQCLAPNSGRLVVVAVGISRYADPAMRTLRYAAKDARDIESMFAKRARVHASEVLLDEDATREQILERSKNLLRQTTEDDTVVLFFAGHGVLDTREGYVLCTHDVEPRCPGRRGLPFAAIEGLFDCVPARQRLLLIDSCHSGEDEPVPVGATSGTYGLRDVRPPSEDEDAAKPLIPAAFTRLHELFADLRRESGAVIIAAAASTALALESPDWENGALTAALLEGLGALRADADGDGLVQISELRNFVLTRVPELTNGAQLPSIRRENIVFDFPII